jgi:OmpA-OmpF porin, OOP family
VVEYAIKTPEKEIWIQLVPSTIGSSFYSILIIIKESHILGTNILKKNTLLQDLEKNKSGITQLNFGLNTDSLLTESKDELLQIVNIFQVHPDWKLKIDVHSAPLSKPDYVLSLAEKRAAAKGRELQTLGLMLASVVLKGLGNSKPLLPNDTEKA